VAVSGVILVELVGGWDSNVQLRGSDSSSWGAESRKDSSGDLEIRLESAWGMLEEALTGSGELSPRLPFFFFLLGLDTSSSSINCTSDRKNLLLASKRDNFLSLVSSRRPRETRRWRMIMRVK